MGSDQYGQAMGRFMELYATMQKNMAESMSRYLSALNMPTRADILTLGDRLAMIEDRLTGIERALARAAPPAERDGATPVVRPPRTRRPASDAGGPTAPGATERGA